MAPVPCKLLENTLRHTRSEEDLAVLCSAAERSLHDDQMLDVTMAADFDLEECWSQNDDDVVRVICSGRSVFLVYSINLINFSIEVLVVLLS